MRGIFVGAALLLAGCSEESSSSSSKKTTPTTTTVSSSAVSLPASSTSASLRSHNIPILHFKVAMYMNHNPMTGWAEKLKDLKTREAILAKLLSPLLEVDAIAWRFVLMQLEDGSDDPQNAARLVALAGSSAAKLAEMTGAVAKYFAELMSKKSAAASTAKLGALISEAVIFTKAHSSDEAHVQLWLNGYDRVPRVSDNALVKKIFEKIVSEQLGVNGAVCLRLIEQEKPESHESGFHWAPEVTGGDLIECQSSARNAFNGNLSVFVGYLVEAYYLIDSAL